MIRDHGSTDSDLVLSHWIGPLLHIEHKLTLILLNGLDRLDFNAQRSVIIENLEQRVRNGTLVCFDVLLLLADQQRHQAILVSVLGLAVVADRFEARVAALFGNVDRLVLVEELAVAIKRLQLVPLG